MIVLLFATCAAREACAGLMASATFSPACPGWRSGQGAISGEATAGERTMTGAAESSSERRTDHESAERESTDRADLKLLAAQPAQGGAGATGSATSVTGGFAPAAMISLTGLPSPPEPTGVCVELKNSDLPAPPAAEMLRPPRRDV